VLSFPVMVAAHSTEGGGLRPVAWLAEVLLVALLAGVPALAAHSAPAGASPSTRHWTHIERRIESGYFRQDAVGLAGMAATLSLESGAASDAKDTEWQNYYAALAAYRVALLAGSDETRAWPYAQQCIDRLNRVLVVDTSSAEALALQSACLALQSNLDPWRSPLAAPLSRARGDQALKLAPDNPRVLLLGALATRERPRFFGGDSQQAYELLLQSVSAFEHARTPVPGQPGWGAAEAFTYLAQDYLTRGQALAARNVLERALLVAPDFTQAKRLMAEIIAG
jgi:tetratricopeptide (TPR) repeat protein